MVSGLPEPLAPIGPVRASFPASALLLLASRMCCIARANFFFFLMAQMEGSTALGNLSKLKSRSWNSGSNARVWTLTQMVTVLGPAGLEDGTVLFSP